MAIFTAILNFTLEEDDYADALETAQKIGELVLSEDGASDFSVLDVELQEPDFDEEDDEEEE